MASQNESDEKSRNEEIKSTDSEVHKRTDRSTDVESKGQQFEPFAADDPWRTTRTREVVSETKRLLEQIQTEPIGFENATPKQLRSFQQNATERASWSQARQDGFIGLLRLGRPVPPRSKRIL